MSEEQQPQEAAGADWTAPEDDTPADTPAEPQDAVQAPTAAQKKAALEAALRDVQAEVDEEHAQRLANADPADLCPTCGQLPPPAAPPAGAREIWCPTCNQRLANLIPGQ